MVTGLTNEEINRLVNGIDIYVVEYVYLGEDDDGIIVEMSYRDGPNVYDTVKRWAIWKKEEVKKEHGYVIGSFFIWSLIDHLKKQQLETVMKILYRRDVQEAIQSSKPSLMATRDNVKIDHDVDYTDEEHPVTIQARFEKTPHGFNHQIKFSVSKKKDLVTENIVES